MLCLLINFVLVCYFSFAFR